MPLENLEDQGLEKTPNLELAQCKFLLTLPEFKTDRNVHAKISDAIKKDDMAPWYELICRDAGWKLDQAFLKQLKTKNEEYIKKLDETIEDAEKNLSEMEVRDAYLRKAEYYSKIGDKENAISTFRQAYDKTVSLGHRLDIIFHMIRIGLFFMDHDIITRNIEKAKTLIEEGGDWDRRNRLKVYQETVSTFTSYELMDYKTFVRYTVYVCLISLPRNQLRDQVVKGSEILEVLHSEPFVKDYLFSLYNCQYADFFKNLAHVEDVLRKDYLLHPHYRYYIREMRILAYTQLLESYRSLTLQYMAEAFDVSQEFIDK
ncbi:26S proteasome subunit RPN7 [Popillia japonica]|uniref:26S proteasome subunit RPN7 n=1 Tax=Popillia japonica TaxID=7064 RepID=A0AAW1ICB9_POPJA